MEKKTYDFSGWATKNNIRCSDGRTIRKDAFKANDGEVVPLVWNHDHKNMESVIGHALLENREEGVYAYGSLNDTELGKKAREMIRHRDVRAMSIYANQLKQSGDDVIHGKIREVSLVLAGANPGAYIDTVIAHSDDHEEEAIVYHPYDDDGLVIIEHKDDAKPVEDNKMAEETKKPEGEKTVQDVFDTLTDEQKNVVYFLIAKAAEGKGEATNPEDKEMKQNAFENENNNGEGVLSHAEFMEVINDAKRSGSLKDAFIQHGITNIDYLFPEFKNVTDKPGFINTNPLGWVSKIMSGVHHTPFSRIKMMFADITGEDARAKGYVKGAEKAEEVFSLLKRTVDPQTVYKKQAMDRDDHIDITDFDVVAWLKSEMRMKLDEELARAIIFGDGRSTSSADKIKETHIIPVVKDTQNNLYAMATAVTVPAGETLASALIDFAVKAQDGYEGSGNLTAFFSQSDVSDMLLLKDKMGRRIYKDINELATAMAVNEIVKVPAAIMPAGVKGVILDLADYNVGADKGGAVNMFDDFDIDYNKEKYLIETRCSGALVKPHSAIVLNYTPVAG